MIRYKRDVFLARLRRKIHSLLPPSLLGVIEPFKLKNAGNPLNDLLTNDTHPWMSPNIWAEITDYYYSINGPVIFEYGMGASTLQHFSNLCKLGSGTYIGVEKQQDWFWMLLAAVTLRASKLNGEVEIKTCGDNSIGETDVSLTSGEVRVLMKLRTSIDSYVKSYDQSCDVLVIDGAFRKECVRYALSSGFLKPGGLLMLMEAGRGSPNWWEGKLYGDNDYTEEVEEMRKLGGILLDGNGVDSWPNSKRRSPVPPAYYYPLEACKLIYPST